MTKTATLVVATNNAHKLKEIADIFYDYNVVSQKEMGFCEDVEENGTSFLENALIKARVVAKKINLPVLADDSGLCVDALNGAPGIYSARYGGEHGNDRLNRSKLLSELEGVENRGAHFTCAIAMVYLDGREITAEGKTEGYILTDEVGNDGFGYDCIFYSTDLNKSFSEATAEEKNSVSHRARALQNLRKII